MYYDSIPIDTLVGKTLKSVVVDKENKFGDEIKFTTTEGKCYMMRHEQDCCEDASIDDIAGDLDDLVGSPILDARMETNSDKPQPKEYDESWTWTFYILATIKGTVTLRWYVSSNGYYSEEVTFREAEDDTLHARR